MKLCKLSLIVHEFIACMSYNWDVEKKKNVIDELVMVYMNHKFSL